MSDTPAGEMVGWGGASAAAGGVGGDLGTIFSQVGGVESNSPGSSGNARSSVGDTAVGLRVARGSPRRDSVVIVATATVVSLFKRGVDRERTVMAPTVNLSPA